MNNLDKNVHINFMPLYLLVSVMFLMLIANNLQSQEIEEVIITGANVYESESDPSSDVNVLETIMPEATQAGG